MSRPHDMLCSGLPGNEPAECDDRIEDYLDYLCAPLLGVVPYSERRSLRDEARQHLRDIAAEYELQGLTPQEALTSALHIHGNPWKIGQAFVKEWSDGPSIPVGSAIRRATFCAFVWFGGATALCLLMIEQYARDVSSSIVFTRGYPMPISYQDVLFPYLLGLILLSPIVAGSLTGAMAPHQMLRGIVNAVAILCVDSFVTACLLLPKTEGFSFVLVLIGLWLPVGSAAAVATATLRRYKRCQRFRQLAR